MPGERVLVVEDDVGAAEVAARVCRQEGCDTRIAGSVSETLTLLGAESPSILILDLSLPDGDGVEILHAIRADHPKARVILVSGFDEKVLGTVRQLAEALGVEVVDDLAKPFSLEQLREALATALALGRTLSAEDLAAAIAAGQITLAYQPKIDLRASGFAAAPSVEALVRWRHPHHGDIPPYRLLSLAEQSGRTTDLTWAVIRTAVRQMETWRAAGMLPKVSINLAPEVLDDRRLPDEISALALAHGIDRTMLGFEITETAATEHSALVLDIATRFRLQGMSLSIDDFGTGYSSLRQLYLMPFNELKIDISFVAEMARREQARTLVKASIDLAHNLGMTACAEGVEDFDTLTLLHAMGCDSVQGYFISRPLPAERLDIIMRGWNNPFGG